MTLQKSNVQISTILTIDDPSLDEERHIIAAAEVGVGSANHNPSDILSIREICNFNKPLDGYIPENKEYIRLSPYESTIEKYETDLFFSMRKGQEIRTNASAQTQFTSNTLYLLVQGSMEISYDNGEKETFSPFVGENWSSEYPNFRYSTNCTVELSMNSSLFIIELLKPVSNYGTEHIKFNGTIEKFLDSDTTIIVKPINTSANNNSVYINGELCRTHLICNGNVSLHSSGDAICVLLKSK